jgi:hypothetical protein
MAREMLGWSAVVEWWAMSPRQTQEHLCGWRIITMAVPLMIAARAGSFDDVPQIAKSPPSSPDLPGEIRHAKAAFSEKRTAGPRQIGYWQPWGRHHARDWRRGRHRNGRSDGLLWQKCPTSEVKPMVNKHRSSSGVCASRFLACVAYTIGPLSRKPNELPPQR